MRTRHSGVLFHSKFDNANLTMPALISFHLFYGCWWALAGMYQFTRYWNEVFLRFKDKNTPFSTNFSQLLIKLQVRSCKLIMLRYFTIVSVVFPSSPCSIAVVFNMFVKFASVCLQLQTRHPSSARRIHLLARAREREKWKIELCYTFRLQKCIRLIKYMCKE